MNERYNNHLCRSSNGSLHGRILRLQVASWISADGHYLTRLLVFWRVFRYRVQDFAGFGFSSRGRDFCCCASCTGGRPFLRRLPFEVLLLLRAAIGKVTLLAAVQAESFLATP